MYFSINGPVTDDRSILSDEGDKIGGPVLQERITSSAKVTRDGFGTVASGEITVVIEVGEDVSWPDVMRLFDNLVEQSRQSFLKFLVEEAVR